MGLRSFHNVNKASSCKRFRNHSTSNAVWAKWMRLHYNTAILSMGGSCQWTQSPGKDFVKLGNLCWCTCTIQKMIIGFGAQQLLADSHISQHGMW